MTDRLNRVDPWGRVFETRERGYLAGNRDSGDAWIASQGPSASISPCITPATGQSTCAVQTDSS